MSSQSLLSLREVAHRLGVDYNTVYRLVRRGELAAAKIGTVYRLRPEDVDAYVVQQIARTREAAQSVGALRAEEAAPDADGPDADGYGADGYGADGYGAEDAPPPALRCDHCLRLIKGLLTAGGVCREPTCEAVLCRECVDQGHVLCRRHAPSPAEKLADARLARSRGDVPLLVTAVEARRRELNFVRRFEYKVDGSAALPHPDGGAPVRAPNRSAVSSAEEALAAVGVAPGNAQRAPRNARRRYTVAQTARREGFVLEARVASRRAAFLQDGFDTQPLDDHLLLDLLNGYAREADETGLLFIVGLAATTGWSAEALHLLDGPRLGEGWTHPKVWPCLIDLEARAVVGPVVPTVRPFLPYFRLPLPEEEVRAVERYVQHAVETHLNAAEIESALGVTPGAVLTAFQRLVAQGGYYMEEMPGIGWVLASSDPFGRRDRAQNAF